MAFTIIWTETAVEDLQAVVQYIARDNPDAARRLAKRILDRIEVAAAFPQSGRIVPEKQDSSVREVLLKPYRIIYTLDALREAIHVVRIWHSSREYIAPW